ncbi:hypothetical protein BGX34_000933 [Mortierella sp. NVP85]|nr:hypothetical protein BGX34_000933 [Mortierella sp. NVP85]
MLGPCDQQNRLQMLQQQLQPHDLSQQQEHDLQEPQRQHTIQYQIEPHLSQMHGKEVSILAIGPRGVLIPGAQVGNVGSYIHITEDPSAEGNPLWCTRCHHVKPERAHHCRVCKRCVLKMDHHCPWVLNCVGQENYKFFVLFVSYTAIHCMFMLASLIPLYVRFPEDSWTHHIQIVAMVLSGIFGVTLVVFALTHIRLILLNRTTIEDHSTPYDEGIFPCFRNGWATSEGEINQGNERLYDLGLRANWEQAMGKGWRCLVPVRFPLPEGPVHNKKVVERQMRDLYQQEETRQQQQQEHPPQRYRRADEDDAIVAGFECLSPLENGIGQDAVVGSTVPMQEDAPSSSAKASESSSS